MIQISNTFRHSSSSILNGKQHRKTRVWSFQSVLIYALIVIAMCMLPCCQTKETVLLPYLKTKNDKILLRLLMQTNYHIKHQSFIKQKSLNCLSIIKNDLTKNQPQSIQPLRMSLDYGKVLKLHSKQPSKQFSEQEIQLTRKIDSILDMTKGICLYYTTFAFIYEYCHKEHVRQFDTQLTKYNSQKPLFQDISMGVYDPIKYASRQIHKIQLTEEEKKVTAPQSSDFSQDYNHLFAEDIDNVEGKLQLQESVDGNLLHSAVHLSASDSIVQSPIILELNCEDNSLGQMIEITNYAILVTPYDLVYTLKKGRCDRLSSFKSLSLPIKYFKDNSPTIIRVFANYLYGNVEQVCGSNWDWQRQGQGEAESFIQKGSVLLLKLWNFKTKSLQHHYVTVKNMINSELIQLQTHLGQSFYKQNNVTIKFVENISNRLISNVTHCQLLFNRALNFQKGTMNNKYIGSHLMKLNQNIQQASLQNSQLACLCKLAQTNFKSQKIVDMIVRVGKQLWTGFYSAYITTNTHIYSPQHFKQKLFRDCDSIICYPFKQQQQPVQTDTKNGKFTTLIKLNSKHAKYNFTEQGDRLYVINLRKQGIIKLVTVDSQGTTYYYLISQGQIIKMRQFQNGTKQIIKQNHYYENSTMPGQDLYKNYIYIYVNKLTNGTNYGGIWKYDDYAIFPRFVLLGQTLVSLQLLSEYCNLRIIDTSLMNNPDAIAIKKYMKILKATYQMNQQEKQTNQQQVKTSSFLESSYSVNYTYVSGLYCGEPINKFRQTIVTIKCGKPWFQITKLLETSPCQYWLQIQSTLLCREGFQNVVELDQQIPNKGSNDQIIFNGVNCIPSSGLFDSVSPYLYSGKY